MPRRSRCLVPGSPCHVTQRGVDRCETYSSDQDPSAYLRLLGENLDDAQVRLLGWCLMTNHVHLIALPQREDSLAILLRRVHGRYAQYYNTHMGRTGHLWQNRFFACVLGKDHLWTALAYVDRNPVRAGMVRAAADYRWSSAAAHLSGADRAGLLDGDWWRAQGRGGNWAGALAVDDLEAATTLRRCTYSGRPFGSESLVQEIAQRFGRCWTRGRPRKEPASETAPGHQANQLALL
ncbi:MAG: transposase [Bryobacteraceae bacterium]|jgi:putative transposase